METRLRAVFEAGELGVPVARLCRELGISRDSYYRYRRRWESEGPAGLVDRSRRPHRSPQAMSIEVEDEIVRLRKNLELDRGAQTIAYHLERAGWKVPSVRAIHRALVRRGMVVPEPHKRPKSVPWKRFEWPLPNGAWQIDATCWALADGREVWVMDILDDHSRLVVAARVHPGPTSRAAFDALWSGAARYGLPARVMSDNGSCFTGRFNGGVAPFERTLGELGIAHLLSSPHHPQTCGKLERFHQTLKQWLRARPLATTPVEFQTQLDEFLEFYNHRRPHRSLHGATPAERWAAQPPDHPRDAIARPIRTGVRKVSRDGTLGWGAQYLIGIGMSFAGQHLLVIDRDDDLTICGPAGIIRTLTLDHTRRYQPQRPT